jgi:hypothetical protein
MWMCVCVSGREAGDLRRLQEGKRERTFSVVLCTSVILVALSPLRVKGTRTPHQTQLGHPIHPNPRPPPARNT